MIVTNVTSPYALTAVGSRSRGVKKEAVEKEAAKKGGPQKEGAINECDEGTDQQGTDNQGANNQGANSQGAGMDDRQVKTNKDGVEGADTMDNSAASLVGLYVVSDVLLSSSTSGVRHAWRFRQLFETSLREHGTLETLGMMADRLGWGRMRAEKWKRSVNLVLAQWETWCVFTAEAQQAFVRQFEEPAELVQRKAEAVEREGGRERREAAVTFGWKKVAVSTVEEERDDEDAEGAPMDMEEEEEEEEEKGYEKEEKEEEKEKDGEEEQEDDAPGEPMQEDDDEAADVAGEPMDDEDVEGLAMDDEDVEGVPMDDADDDDDDDDDA
jgi:U2-associated protein SR140